MEFLKLFLYIFISLFIYSKTFAVDTEADQAIVIDFNTNEILFEKNADVKIHPASLTKIMSIYVAFDRLKNSNLNIEDTCIVSAKSYKMGGSRTFLEIDDNVTINDLLRGIIIQSGNDASVALAECLSGTENDFAKLMNIYAKKMNLRDSNFLNSSGWPEENHYSTVKDIAIISNFLIRDFPNLYTYFNEKNFTYNSISQPNRNKLLFNFNGADGLKTGYVKSSGWSIAGSALRGERRITAVISGTSSSRSRLNESSNLLKWAFTQTSEKVLLKKNQLIKDIDVWLGNKPTVGMVVENDVVSILSFDQVKSIQSSIEYEKPIKAPIKKGDQIGIAKIVISGKSPIIVPLVSNKDVSNINPIKRIFAAIKYLIFGTTFDEL